MKTEEVIEGNKLIAKFLGWELSVRGHKFKRHLPPYGYVRAHPSYLRFHCSLDWMMLVIEKLERLQETEDSLPFFDINSHYVRFGFSEPYVDIIAGCYETSPELVKFNTKLEAVFYVSVMAIEEWNRRNKPKE